MRPVIVGASVAGTVCALRLAREGIESVVLERRARPGDKVCGEGLLPAGRAVIEDLLLPLVEHNFFRRERPTRETEAAATGGKSGQPTRTAVCGRPQTAAGHGWGGNEDMVQ